MSWCSSRRGRNGASWPTSASCCGPEGESSSGSRPTGLPGGSPRRGPCDGGIGVGGTVCHVVAGSVDAGCRLGGERVPATSRRLSKRATAWRDRFGGIRSGTAPPDVGDWSPERPGTTRAVRLEVEGGLVTRTHTYRVDLEWTGDGGMPGFVGYDRDHVVVARGRPPILGSSDPAFLGSRDRWNPEQLLVASIAQCHLLWYLHLACWSGVVVHSYRDAPEG